MRECWIPDPSPMGRAWVWGYVARLLSFTFLIITSGIYSYMGEQQIDVILLELPEMLNVSFIFLIACISKGAWSYALILTCSALMWLQPDNSQSFSYLASATRYTRKLCNQLIRLCCTGKKRKRCGECAGCMAIDCGSCKFCHDKPKFGGQGKMKKPCINRKCSNLHEVGGNPKQANAPERPLTDISNIISRGKINC